LINPFWTSFDIFSSRVGNSAQRVGLRFSVSSGSGKPGKIPVKPLMTHNTTFSRHFGLPNFRHPFMFARRFDQRWR